CANGMVFVGERRTEERHDAVAHHLIDRPLVVMDGFHHELEHRVENPSSVLGVTLGEEFHRSFQIGEEHRDLLTLTFERVLCREDPLGEVAWRVVLSRACRRRCPRNGMSARMTELRPDRNGCAAARARYCQWGSTFFTKPRRLQVLVCASRAFHAE